MLLQGAMDIADLRRRAVRAHAVGDLKQAEVFYTQLLGVEPAPDIASNYGALLRSQGRLEEAEAHYRSALSAFPDDIHLLCNACNLLRDRGQAEETIALLKVGLQNNQNNYSLRQALALSLHHCRRIEEALQLLPQLVSENPSCLETRLEYGACLAKRDSPHDALQQFREASALAPEDVRPVANQITILVQLGQLNDAERLLALDGLDLESPRMLGARAELLFAQGDVESALALHQKLTQYEPKVPDHWLNVAACHKALRRIVAPTLALEKAFSLDPSRLDVQFALGGSLVEQGRCGEGLQFLQNSLDQPGISDEVFTVHQFVSSCYRLLPPDQLRLEVQRWEQRRALPLQQISKDRIRDPGLHRPLKVGYLSPDFCNHPVGRFMAPLLEAHDPSQVEVVALFCGRINDHFTQRIQRACSSWHDLRFGRDEEMARYLADLQLDVIVELGGYSSDQRLRPLFARPAPIQLSYLGYPASTYLGCIDGWIGDPACFGPDQSSQCGDNEQLLPLSRSYIAYPLPEDAPLPERRAPDRRFRFGCFNHSRKLSDECLDRFVRVIQAVPGSILVLKSTTFEEVEEQARIKARLQQRGLALDQIEMYTRSPDTRSHLASYGLMDVALDTWPYSGTTTSCEALWMGVPVLTVLGDVMVERQTSAVLAAANLGSAISASMDQLVQKAQLLASQGCRDTAQRMALRQHVANSDLADCTSLARSLEHLYRHLWSSRGFEARL